jgi:hypothetical protein
MLLPFSLAFVLLAASAAVPYVTVENGSCESHGHRTITRIEECELAARTPELLCGLGLPRRRLQHLLTRLDSLHRYEDEPVVNPKWNPVLLVHTESQIAFFENASKVCNESNHTRIPTQGCWSWPSCTDGQLENMFWKEIIGTDSTGTKPHGCTMYLRQDAVVSSRYDATAIWVTGFGGQASPQEPQICATQHACPVGKYHTGVKSCASCGPGFFAQNAGQWSCSSCPEGHFCPGGATYTTVAEHGSTSKYSTDPCTSAGYVEIFTEKQCKEAAENRAFLASPNASWGGLVDFKDTACTRYVNVTCPFEADRMRRNLWKQPTGCFIYLRHDTMVTHHVLGKLLWGQGYEGEPEPLQPQVCITSRRACPPGKYQPGWNSSHCTECSVGMFQDEAAESLCKACPVGKYAPSQGESECFECLPGEYQQLESQQRCESCSCSGPNEFCHPRKGCVQCMAGGKPNTDRTECVGGCPIGQFVEEGGWCTDCGPGFFCPGQIYDTVPIMEYCASRGQAPVASEAVCRHAASNANFVSDPGAYFEAITSDGAEGVLLERDGEEGGSDGGSGDSEQDIIGCVLRRERGKGAVGWADWRGNATATAAAANATAVWRVCIDHRKRACPAGKHQPNTSSAACADCPAGRYANAPGAAECSFCAQGHYSLGNQLSVECEPCGTFFSEGTEVGKVQQQCELCEPGQYRHSGACAPCKAGRFQPDLGQQQCRHCPEGQFQSLAGRSYCDTIAPDSVLTTNMNTGVVTALRCPPFGVDCKAGNLQYIGNVWHDPTVLTPNCTVPSSADEQPVCTAIYVCSNDGCPSAGATEMKCKQGYTGVLCASCDTEY